MPIRFSPIPICAYPAIVLAVMLPWLVSCTSPTRITQEPLSTRSSANPQIIALIDGSPITQAQLQDDLGERAGKQALIDLILDRLLEAKLRDEQIQITQNDLDREEQLFVRTIRDLSPDAPRYELLKALKASRGLGPTRYPRFIRRNAMLRKLVGADGIPTEPELKLAQRIAFGPKYRVRLFVTNSHTTANELRQQLLETDLESRKWIFAQQCQTDSIHPSAPRGGLITDLSTDDPRYPLVITNAIESIDLGEFSGVLATDAGYAVVLVESQRPAIEQSPEQIESIRNQLAARKQRLAMQRVAEDLLSHADVVVMDSALNWAWNTSK